MPHIFQFHKGTQQNIYDWTISNRIVAGDLVDVDDKTIDISSSIGTSIPTPIARMFLFETAFQIVAKQTMKPEGIDPDNIYCGLVSEVLDLLELLYMHGGSGSKIEFKDWKFDSFGSSPGHRLLDESFRQAIAHEPFNGNLNITLIYFKEERKEPVLIGGTSPFTFVFTAPNFRENLKRKNYREINGLVSNDKLFDNEYKALQERDAGFIQYMKYLVTEGAKANSISYKAIGDYVYNTGNRYSNSIKNASKEEVEKNLKDISYGQNGVLNVSGIHLKYRSEADYKQKIEEYSDFKITLPQGSMFKGQHKPLFLLDKMHYQGNYTSPTKKWSSSTKISDKEYDETTLDGIENRALPDDGSIYPFISDFDLFERCLVKLPGYKLNNEKFVCIVQEQDFLLPLKPIFFNLFPSEKIRDYVEVSSADGKVTVSLKIPVNGNGQNRVIVCSRTYDSTNTITYSGILGIFPFVKSNKGYLNQYTVAAFEKTNVPLLVNGIEFYKKDATTKVGSKSHLRTSYLGINTQSTYYLLESEFSIIQLKFMPDNSECGGVIIPKFNEIENGGADYVYAIDFGTSNTHIEFSPIVEGAKTAKNIEPFEVKDENMLMTLLNKPLLVRENNGDVEYYDYDKRSLGAVIDSARQITLREFIPFQFGSHKSASFRFPFRTTSFEKSRTFKDSKTPTLFVDSNIGFNIDNDLNNLNDLNDKQTNAYQTNLKWLLESNTDSLNENRVSLFFRQLLMMIRTHALQQKVPANIDTLKIAFSYPISMGAWLENPLKKLLWKEMKLVFGIENEIRGGNKIEEDEEDKRLIPVTESIAPYYLLLDKDQSIQHYTYCNIDIGGGTSDIVLVKKEGTTLLRTYSSSIKFAGRQLWGSASNNDYDSNSNGFVQYYKKFLANKEPQLYSDIKQLLEGRSAKTEDIVSYLFSHEELKFKSIFTECKELRVPLLIHYSAILFFIAKTCKVRGIELPKTVSFSGKGSEYISLLFPNKKELKDFTQYVLKKFSGLSINSEFKTIISEEPKVITAKGSVSYSANPRKVKEKSAYGNDESSTSTNSGDLEIDPNEIYHYGSDDIGFETGNRKYAEFTDNSEGFKKVLECNKEFLDALFDDTNLMNGLQRKEALGIDSLKRFKDEFFLKPTNDLFANGVLRDSFLNVIEKKKLEATAEDSPFFFAFSSSLIQLSKYIAEKSK